MAHEPPLSDEPDVDLDEDLEEFLAAWDESDREATEILCTALNHVRGQPPPREALAAAAAALRDGLRERHHPFGWIRSAADLDSGPLPDDDAELVVRCAAATISPLHETGLDPEEEASLISLERADWLGAIVSVVRAGLSADASPETLAASIRTCPEVEMGPDVDPDDDALPRRRSGSSRCRGRCSA